MTFYLLFENKLPTEYSWANTDNSQLLIYTTISNVVLL